jgi:RHS repeat-associated protein
VFGNNTYKWDGANRVILFSNPASNVASRFVYDGLGRLVRVIDAQGGTVTADHSYTWCGSTRCLAHDNTQSGSPVSTQYFSQGVIVSGTPYYYVQDHLGSVNQLVTTSGSVAVRYTYDPYGNRTTVSGTAVSDIGYAGYFYHQLSGLDFTLHRAYDPVHARWLNRDPIGEAGGVNLYAYADDNPVNEEDPSGKCPWCIGVAIGAVAGAIGGYEAAGWKGAAAGALAGGVTGFVAPWAAEAAGFGAGTGLAGAAAVVGSGAASGALGTVAANAASGQPLSNGIGFGATVGALAPLISGEAFIVGAAGVEGTAPYWLSGASGAIGAFGGALDPEAENGIKPVVPLSVTPQSCHR